MSVLGLRLPIVLKWLFWDSGCQWLYLNLSSIIMIMFFSQIYATLSVWVRNRSQSWCKTFLRFISNRQSFSPTCFWLGVYLFFNSFFATEKFVLKYTVKGKLSFELRQNTDYSIPFWLLKQDKLKFPDKLWYDNILEVQRSNNSIYSQLELLFPGRLPNGLSKTRIFWYACYHIYEFHVQVSRPINTI